MESSNRIVLAEKAMHEVDKRYSIKVARRGHGFDLWDKGAEWAKLNGVLDPDASVRWFVTAEEARGAVDFLKAEAVVAALDAYPATVELFFERFEEDFYKNWETSEATDEGRMLAKAIFKPLVAWWEAGQGKRKSTPSGMTLAMARLFGFFLYTVNAATIPRESGQRLEGLADLVLDVRHAAQQFQAEDDREGFVEVDLLAADTKTEGNA